MQINYTGSIVAVAGLLVAGLNYFGIIISQNQVVEIIAGLVTLYGVIQQAIAHKQLAVSAGLCD